MPISEHGSPLLLPPLHLSLSTPRRLYIEKVNYIVTSCTGVFGLVHSSSFCCPELCHSELTESGLNDAGLGATPKKLHHIAGLVDLWGTAMEIG